MREAAIEKHFIKQAVKRGGITYKWTSTHNGVPDRILLLYGETFFIELKKKGGVPGRMQQFVGDQILEAGGHWECLAGIEQVEVFFTRLDEIYCLT